MAAGRLIIPGFFPALDRNGDPVEGAKLYVYQNETTTLVTVYSNEALTTPLTNPVIANSAGGWPAIWADQANQYSVTITGPNGKVFRAPNSFDNVTPSVDADTAAAVLAEAAADEAVEAAEIAVAAAADAVAGTAGKVDKSAFEASSGFVFQTGTTATDFESRPFASEFDFIAYDDTKPLNSDVMKPVIDVLAAKDLGNLDSDAADNFETERVIGRPTLPLRTLLRDWVWFDEEIGADISGSLDPLAVSANNAAFVQCAGRVNASATVKTIRFKGQVSFNGGLGAFGDGVRFIGEEGRYATVLIRANTTGTLLRVGHDSKIEGLKIINSAGPLTSSAVALECLDKNGFIANDLTISGHYVNLRLVATVTNTFGGHRLRNINLLDAQDQTIAGGSASLLIEGCYDVRGDNIVIAPSGATAGRPTYGFKHGAGNSSFWHGLNVTDQGYAFYAAPTEEMLQVVISSSCLDKNLQGDTVFVRPGVGGSVRYLQFVATELGNSASTGGVFDGTLGLIDSPSFIGPTVFNNVNYGLYFNGGGSAVTTSRGIRNVMIGQAGVSSCGISGVYFDQYVKNFTFSGNAGIGGGYGGNGNYGLEGGVGVDNYRVMLTGDGNTAGLTNLTDNGTTKRVI